MECILNIWYMQQLRHVEFALSWSMDGLVPTLLIAHLLSEFGKRLSQMFLSTLSVRARRPTLEPHAWHNQWISRTYLQQYRFPNPNRSTTSSAIILIQWQVGATAVPIRIGVMAGQVQVVKITDSWLPWTSKQNTLNTSSPDVTREAVACSGRHGEGSNCEYNSSIPISYGTAEM